jgi:hypothetical protein
MWFLWFYGISIVVSIFIAFIIGKSITSRLKNNGYEEKNKVKKSIWELLATLLFFLIPFINIIFALLMIFGQTILYEKMRDEDYKKIEIDNTTP